MLNLLTSTGSSDIRQMAKIGGYAVTRTGSTISTLAKDRVHAPISEPFLRILLEDEHRQIDTTPGAIVQLVGQIALPCVCEVSPSCAPLFSPAGAKVVSQGITWQSLYLVLIEHNFVLVEPDRDASGDGRVVTRCPLEDITLDRDPPDARADTSARRLKISCHGRSTTPPGLFMFETLPDLKREGSLVRSKVWKSLLDVWFEDNKAVAAAFRKVQETITDAKVERGSRILMYLSQNEGSSYPRNTILFKK